MLVVLQRNSFEKIQKNEYKLLVLKDYPKTITLVLFTGNNCPYCETMKSTLERIIPIFESRINFCTINLSNYPELIQASVDTTTNIKEVPYVVIYVDNIPFSLYKGGYSEQEVTEYLNALLQPPKSSADSITKVAETVKQATNESLEPVIIEKSSYLTLNEAYKE
jgi:glutaredoxin